jgi:regulator of replication initiation timing
MGLRVVYFEIFCLVIVVTRCSRDADKRILLDDPHLLQSQIQTLQQDLLNLKNQLNAQVNTNNAQQAEINSLKRSADQPTNQGMDRITCSEYQRE